MAELRAALCMLVAVMIVGLCPAGAPRAQGANWYVDASAFPGGDGTPQDPFQTIGEAGQMTPPLQPDDVVIVEEGVYPQDTISLDENANGTAGHPIVFRPASGAKAILDGQGACESAVSLEGHSYVRIEGFEIRRYTGDAMFLQSAAADAVGTGFEIVGNHIHHCGAYLDWTSGTAIEAANIKDTLIQDNEIAWCGGPAIHLGGTGNQADRVIIRGNNIHHIGGDGIQGIGNNVLIEYNRMYDSCWGSVHQDGLQMSYCNNIIFRYNVIGDFTQLVYGGVDADNQHDFMHLYIYGNVFYNTVYNNVYGGGCPGVIIDNSNVTEELTLGDIQIHSNTFLYLGEAAIYLGGSPSCTLRGLRIYNNIFYACRGLGDGNGARDWEYFGAQQRDMTHMSDIECDYNCYYGYGYSYATLGTHDNIPGDLSYYEDSPAGFGCDRHSLVLPPESERILESYDLTGSATGRRYPAVFNARVQPQYWQRAFEHPNSGGAQQMRIPYSNLAAAVTLPPHLDGNRKPIFAGDGPFQDMDGYLRPSSGRLLMGAYTGARQVKVFNPNGTLASVCTTIAAAIADQKTASGCTVVVSPGTYCEPVDFGNKSLALKSIDPRNPAIVAATIIDGQGADSAVKLSTDAAGATSSLHGLTICGGSEGGAGGVLVRSRKTTIANCVIASNTGLGIAEAAGLAAVTQDPLSIYNCVITNNTGGGVSIVGQGRSVRDCTIAFNGGSAGIVVGQQASVTVANCIVWGNQGQQIGGGERATVISSDLTADPHFANPNGMDGDPATYADNDYQLGFLSPCVDAGSPDEGDIARDTLDLNANGNCAEAVPLDIGGNNRICAGRVDMGAYEATGGRWVWTGAGQGHWTVGTSWLKQGAPIGTMDAYPDFPMFPAYIDSGGTVVLDSKADPAPQADVLQLGSSAGTSGFVQMGVNGTLTVGELRIAGAPSSSGTFTLAGDGLSAWSIMVRGDVDAGDGRFQGYGTVQGFIAGTLYNNGRVEAKGDGSDKTLDLSAFRVDNRVIVPVDATYGWYASDRGRLELHEISVGHISQQYAWGDYLNWGSGRIDLVNSMLIEPTEGLPGGDQVAPLRIALLAPDRTTESAVTSLAATGYEPLGIWELDPVPFTKANVAVRYDQTSVAMDPPYVCDSSEQGLVLAMGVWSGDSWSWSVLSRNVDLARHELTATGASFASSGPVYLAVMQQYPGDTDLSGYVDVVDLLSVLYAFGTNLGEPGYEPMCDFNADGAVDVVDLLAMVYDFAHYLTDGCQTGRG